MLTALNDHQVGLFLPSLYKIDSENVEILAENRSLRKVVGDLTTKMNEMITVISEMDNFIRRMFDTF